MISYQVFSIPHLLNPLFVRLLIFLMQEKVINREKHTFKELYFSVFPHSANHFMKFIFLIYHSASFEIRLYAIKNKNPQQLDLPMPFSFLKLNPCKKILFNLPPL
jgi:hypothetical protein